MSILKPDFVANLLSHIHTMVTEADGMIFADLDAEIYQASNADASLSSHLDGKASIMGEGHEKRVMAAVPNDSSFNNTGGSQASGVGMKAAESPKTGAEKDDLIIEKNKAVGISMQKLGISWAETSTMPARAGILGNEAINGSRQYISIRRSEL